MAIVSEETDQNAEIPRGIEMMEQIAQAVGIVEDEHERRQAAYVNDDYTNEMMWVSDTLVAARAEIERLRDRLDLAERYIIEPTLKRNYFADVVNKGLDDESDNLG